jgi:hypothetical protein
VRNLNGVIGYLLDAQKNRKMDDSWWTEPISPASYRRSKRSSRPPKYLIHSEINLEVQVSRSSDPIKLRRWPKRSSKEFPKPFTKFYIAELLSKIFSDLFQVHPTKSSKNHQKVKNLFKRSLRVQPAPDSLRGRTSKGRQLRFHQNFEKSWEFAGAEKSEKLERRL